MSARRAAVVFLGLLTAIQLGTALWRIGIMFQEALRAGRLPVTLGRGLLEEVLLSAMLAAVAWLWLPPGRRDWARWGVHFLVFAWLLALAHLGLGLVVRRLDTGFTWVFLLLLVLAGTLVRIRGPRPDPEPAASFAWHPALVAALVFWLLQAPHLVFPYHWTDATATWACRAFAFDLRGGLQGLFDCTDPSRPPLSSVVLWMGNSNHTMEGRLLPFLMVGAFGPVLWNLLRRVAPPAAPWGVLWFYMTVRVYQGAVSSYADVPVMLAIGIGLVLAVVPELGGGGWRRAAAFAAVAGCAAALIKRDGAVMILVGTGVVVWQLRPRLVPFRVAALAGAAVGVALWLFRPAPYFLPDQFVPEPVNTVAVEKPVPVVPVAWPLPAVAALVQDPADTLPVTPGTFLTMFYGMQGQVLSHYGYGMFVPCWIILAIWVWRRKLQVNPEARLWGRVAVLGWLAIIGIYIVNVLTGHVGRASLYVIRTGFGRHLLHMFVFCLLHAAALASVLIAAPAGRTPEEA